MKVAFEQTLAGGPALAVALGAIVRTRVSLTEVTHGIKEDAVSVRVTPPLSMSRALGV